MGAGACLRRRRGSRRGSRLDLPAASLDFPIAPQDNPMAPLDHPPAGLCARHEPAAYVLLELPGVMRNFRLLPSRVKSAIGQRMKTRRLARALRLAPQAELVAIGSPYGSWSIPADSPRAGSACVCYLAGVGEDASFDLGLIERFGCTVYAFDPVPEAARYAATVAAAEPRWRFQPVGLWREDGSLRFYKHTQPGFVSRSATNMNDRDAYLVTEVRSIDSLM